jgi:hypothetical protein
MTKLAFPDQIAARWVTDAPGLDEPYLACEVTTDPTEMTEPDDGQRIAIYRLESVQVFAKHPTLTPERRDPVILPRPGPTTRKRRK